jgi:transcriptional regulator with XRE-family HTH domain
MRIELKTSSRDFLIALGARIADKRRKAGMYQHDLALYVGLSVSTLSRIEAGQNDVSIYRGELIARALGTTLPRLLGGLL